MKTLTKRLWDIINLKKAKQKVLWGSESAVMVDTAYELDRLDKEIEELDALREKMSSILIRTTNILKGTPDELSRHSWVDLPEVAKNIVDELETATAFINNAFTRYPNLDKDVEDVKRYG